MYEDESLALRARDLIFFTIDLQTVNYYPTIDCFLNNVHYIALSHLLFNIKHLAMQKVQTHAVAISKLLYGIVRGLSSRIDAQTIQKLKLKSNIF